MALRFRYLNMTNLLNLIACDELAIRNFAWLSKSQIHNLEKLHKNNQVITPNWKFDLIYSLLLYQKKT